MIATRLAMPYAFVAAVSTEVIASTSGLGHLVKGSATIMNSAGCSRRCSRCCSFRWSQACWRIRGREVALETVNDSGWRGPCQDENSCAIIAMTICVASPVALAAEQVRIAVSSTSLFFASVYVAKQMGYFDENGLDVSVIDVGSGSNVSPAWSAAAPRSAAPASGTSHKASPRAKR